MAHHTDGPTHTDDLTAMTRHASLLRSRCARKPRRVCLASIRPLASGLWRGALLGLWLGAGAAPPAVAGPPDAPPFRPAPSFTPAGPATAGGALVWLHGGYDSDAFPDGPSLPDWIARVAGQGWDIWRFDRGSGRDPLASGGDALARGVRALKQAGYRHVAVAGQSRGAFIALSALALSGTVDGVVALSPAAHGTGSEQRPRALADFQARLLAATPMRLALVLLADDPFDPDPAARAAAARTAAAHVPLDLLLIDRPPFPTGHMGSYEPAFDARFGACLAGFVVNGSRDGCSTP